MVTFDTFDEFQATARDIFSKNPLATRYVVKYREADGTLVLTVTDDVQKIKYRTEQHSDLKDVERLSALFGMWTSQTTVASVNDLSTDLVGPAEPSTSRIRSQGAPRAEAEQPRGPPGRSAASKSAKGKAGGVRKKRR